MAELGLPVPALNLRSWLLRGYIGIRGCILGLYWDNGKQHGNYYSILNKNLQG